MTNGSGFKIGINDIYKAIVTAGLGFLITISIHTCTIMENLAEKVYIETAKNDAKNAAQDERLNSNDSEHRAFRRDINALKK